MSHFNKATSEFKKRLAHQPVIQRPIITPLPAKDDGPLYTGSNANPNNNGSQVYRASKKKKTEGMNVIVRLRTGHQPPGTNRCFHDVKTIVYSQPQDTGAGKHINSLLLNAINYLKVSTFSILLATNNTIPSPV
jgi:transcription initiation factor TFIIE subunit beta